MQRKEKTARGKPPDIKIRGYLCAREHEAYKDAKCECMIGAHAHESPPLEDEVMLPREDSQGRLAILRTCRKVYNEAIEQLYREPTFCFNNLDQPPFFLRSILPSRLALIQRIQLVYKQNTMTQPRSAAGSLAKHLHRVQKCTFCNLTAWLRTIQQTMTNLRQIEVFLYLSRKMSVPRLGQPWIVNLLALRNGPHSTRNMTLKVICDIETGSGPTGDYEREVKDFIRGMTRELKRLTKKRKELDQSASKTKDSDSNVDDTIRQDDVSHFGMAGGARVEIGAITAF